MKIAFYAMREFDELPMCEQFSKEYGIDFVWTKEPPTKENLSLAKDCIAISCTPCLMTEEYVETLHSYGVKYFHCRSIGFDHLPMAKIKELGMKVSNSTYPTECVANYAIMLILMTTRKYKETMDRAAIQDYSLRGKMGKEIGSLTVGVLGTGHIGRTLIKHLQPFGCKLLAYDKFENEEVKQIATYVDLDTILKESDVITLHMPSNEETYHMINEETLAKMKDGVVIVNTARGGLIDSNALIKYVKNGKVGEAALDVIEDERGLYYYDHCGKQFDNDELALLRSFPNVTVTPHMAFYVESTVANMVQKSFLSVKYFEEGQENPFEV